MFRHILTRAVLAACFLTYSAAHAASVLVIPESSGDTVGMYSALDGSYLGDLIGSQASLATPINAVQGDDGNLYVSDQLGDNISVYSQSGDFLRSFPDPTDTGVLDNVRGITFRNGVLYATVGGGTNANAIAQFDPLTGAFLGNFVEPNTGLLDNPFDIFFLDDGSALISGIDSDNIALFDPNGAFVRNVLTGTAFPEQIEQLDNGNLIYADFLLNAVREFDLTGAIINECGLSGARGVHGLGNGQVLATSGSGVTSIDMSTCASTTVRDGISARFIEDFTPVPVPAALPLLLSGLTALGLFGRRRKAV